MDAPDSSRSAAEAASPISTRKHPQVALDSILNKGFPYSRRLTSHSSCVNALTFSSGDGRFLASAGDDLRVKIWDFHQDDITQPSYTLVGPQKNILSLSFSANNHYLYAGGVCQKVFRYDTSSLGYSCVTSPQAVYTGQEESIRALSCHPFNENLVLSASEDGSVRRYDAREPGTQSAENTLNVEAELTGLQYHPIMNNLFVTSDTRGNVCLRDERMAFGASSERSGSGVVRKYNTKITKRSVSHLCNPEVNSVAFDRDGEKLAATMQSYFPTIYAVSDPDPIALCTGKFLPDGEPAPSTQRTYSNHCTMKHGYFGDFGMGSGEFYGAGSDDFRGYIWKVPPVSQLLEQRNEMSALDWWVSTPPDAVAFTEGYSQKRIVPVEISTPFCVLNGHRSIVNSVIFHPQFLHVVTAGIEKDLILHSPTPGSPCSRDLEKTPSDVRTISEDSEEDRNAYFQALTGESDEDEQNEEKTLQLFDYIIRTEGQRNVFDIRQWKSDSDSDSDGNEDEDPFS